MPDCWTETATEARIIVADVPDRRGMAARRAVLDVLVAEAQAGGFHDVPHPLGLAPDAMISDLATGVADKTEAIQRADMGRETAC
jgi:hypothetical protein